MSDIFSEIAQRTGKTEGHYPDAWKDAKGKLANLDDEDLEFFLESYRVNKIRARGASSGKGEDWVGMIVGHVSLRDLMSKQRDLATEQAEIDLNNVLSHGIRPYNNDNTVGVGRVHYTDGSWKVSNAAEQVILRRTTRAKGTKESIFPKARVAVRR